MVHGAWSLLCRPTLRGRWLPRTQDPQPGWPSARPFALRTPPLLHGVGTVAPFHVCEDQGSWRWSH